MQKGLSVSFTAKPLHMKYHQDQAITRISSYQSSGRLVRYGPHNPPIEIEYSKSTAQGLSGLSNADCPETREPFVTNHWGQPCLGAESQKASRGVMSVRVGGLGSDVQGTMIRGDGMIEGSQSVLQESPHTRHSGCRQPA